MDNSIQAGARTVDISILKEGAGAARQLTVVIQDDGSGMDREGLRRALQFGGTERFNDRAGLGRFGMGLPNSSVSQARRLDVYTWQAPGEVLHSYIDVDEVAAGTLGHVPPAQRRRLPDGIVEAGPSGTLVIWTRCDRLDNKLPGTIARKMMGPLSRTFRYFVWRGGSIRVNGEEVVPVDPLYRHPYAVLSGATDHGPPLHFDIRVPGSRRSSAVTVQFARLPVHEWHDWPLERKRRFGIVGGAGVSVVRAGREIDYGWFFMDRKRRQNYDDWWRCELRFEPELDELFGVTHSKQQVTPAAELLEMISPDLEGIARALSAAVRADFSALERAPKAVARASERERRLIPPPVRLERGHRTESGRAGRIGYSLRVEPTGKQEFFEWRIEGRVLTVIVNEDHAFFRHLLGPSTAGRPVSPQALELLVRSCREGRVAAAQRSGHPRRVAAGMEQHNDGVPGSIATCG